jgi:hypothetical protein
MAEENGEQPYTAEDVSLRKSSRSAIPTRRAVYGMRCMSPFAPARGTARGRKLLSTEITPTTRAFGTG